jgi:ADP-heptose:LPS heptosyltransferase
MNKLSILIIKPDHIGDYILFRNFFKEIKQSKKFRNFELIVFLNSRVREIAEAIDYEVVDKFIWVDLERFVKGGWYYQRKIQEVTVCSYDVVVNAIFGRYMPIENLIKHIEAKEKILIKGTLDERPSAYFEEESYVYSQVVDLSNQKLFEFERFKVAFENILEETIELSRPFLEISDDWHYSIPIESDFCVFFIGADAAYRKWPLSYYAEIIQYLLEYYDLSILIIGGKDEIDDADQLCKSFNTTKVIDITGETTLLDLVALLNKAIFVISNETGAAHISTVLNTPTLVVSNGNDFGKFSPYPLKYNMQYSVIYPFAINDKFSYDNYVEKYYNGSKLDICNVNAKHALVALDNLCKNISIIKNPKNVVEFTNSNHHFSSKQLSTNYQFSLIFSGLYLDLIEIKNTYKRIVIYGNGYFGKVAQYILEDSIIGVVDKNSDLVSFTPYDTKVYSPKSLFDFKYDKILISVLGRENEIIEFLTKDCMISIEKIAIVRIREKGYHTGC